MQQIVDRKEDYSDKLKVQYDCALNMANIKTTAKAEWPAYVTYNTLLTAAKDAKKTTQKALTDATTAYNNAKKAYDDAKKKSDAKPEDTDLATATTNAKNAMDTAEDAKDAAKTADDNAQADVDAAQAKLTAVETAFGNIFKVDYEEDGHAIPMDALYFQHEDNRYLGLTAATYAANAELPVKDYLNAFISGSYLKIDSQSLKLFLKSDKNKEANEDYYTPVLGTAPYDPLDVTSTTVPAIILKKTRSTQQPALTDDVTFVLSFTVEDVFGHKHVKEFDVKMNKPVLQSRKF